MESHEKFNEYVGAFYGELPESQLHNYKDSLLRLVTIFKSDLRVKFHGIDEDKLHRSVVTGLARLKELGAKHPNIHRSENGMYVEAFQHACIRVRTIDAINQTAIENREREKREAEEMSKANDRSELVSVLFDMYSDLKQHCLVNEVENPEVEAYKLLLKADLSEFDFGGYACYVIAMKIPKQNNIYFNEEVVDAINAHPRLPNRTPPGEVHPAANAQGSIGSYLR